MKWNKVKNIVSKVAPLLGGVLGGPFAAAAGGIISEALGVENTPEAIEETLKNNPDAYLKLKEIEAQNEGKLAEWAAKEEIAREEGWTDRFSAMASADQQSTRPKIALMMAQVLCFEILAFTVWCYVNPELLTNTAVWTVFAALTGTPAGLLAKYFGELRKEQGNRLGFNQQGLLQKFFK